MDGAKLPLEFPSFSGDVWQAALGSYFDAKELVAAIRFGWDMSFTSDNPKPKDATRNNQSAMLFPEHVSHYVKKELGFGSLAGPFKPSELPFPIFRSPFGSVKKVKSFWRRTVTDCSQINSGINFFIDPKSHRGAPWKIFLPNSMSIVRAISRARQMYPDQPIVMWKCDMARWYRWLLIDPTNIPFFAVMWENLVYLDRACSFGNRGAALAAQRFIWAVVWMLRTKLPPHPGTYNRGQWCRCSSHCDCGEIIALAYIDDVLGFGPLALADSNFSSFLALANHLNLRLSTTPGHISPPGPRCVALGLEYDLENNTVSLPSAKLSDLVELLKDWLGKPRATERELASLSGKLLQACNVIFAGRLFLNRILSTKRRASKFKQAIYLDEAFRDDVQWWLEALQARNGVSFLVQESTSFITLDASTNGWFQGAPGIGAYNQHLNEYISVSPPPHLHQLHISDLELLAHVLVARAWGPQMASQHVTVHTDNTACFWLVHNGRSAWDHRLRMARLYAMSQIHNDYRAEPAWISTTDNWLADAYSRPAEHKSQQIMAKFVNELGARPTQRHITPEMFDY